MSQVRSQTTATSIAPWISVRSAVEALTFYKAAFGAVELYRLEEEEGKPILAELSVQGAGFWIQEDPESSPKPDVPGSIRMILTVANPDTLFEQAISAGAEVVVPVNEGHGWRIGRLIDPFGHHWEIGKRLV
ncbi:VOC family protein [Paenibacillus lignilyticus]|uniref:VOC family protein n=1 Tax=Paenibacillus lignilyticus TaxID=1172615 RepID=A0ABS5C7A7_9BACL|nr:VOC family protein [Paenibacillus lignilyticus]MBP3961527.1 VOC family protein [Paenibacillus lignilyticus]MBP3963803.1 VOC family protein [Paenibacillus lignilyticus]